jgi:RimJ/RimL family protein N-acetyltransferase
VNNWIPYPLVLEGKTVTLISLTKNHFSELEELAQDKRIWEYYVYNGSDRSRFRQVLDAALIELEKGTQYPWVIFHNADQRLIGSTRFLDLQHVHQKLEIGSTWLHPDYWGTEVNLECKILLLTYSFETLHALRVQLKTDQNNTRSRKAIEKIGGKFEGILRHDMLRDNNTKRNSAYYSIIDDEWPLLKLDLSSKLSGLNDKNS